MSEEDGMPESLPVSHLESDGYLLTNVLWCTHSLAGYHKNPETGIRKLDDDGNYVGFDLIQHGWSNFDKANDIILKGLRKGWDTYKISNILDFIKSKRWCT